MPNIFELDGFEKLLKEVVSIPNDKVKKKELEDIMLIPARQIAKTAKQLVPKDKELLKRAITAVRSKNRNGAAVKVKIRNKGNYILVNAYASSLEFGGAPRIGKDGKNRGSMAAQPFMYPAYVMNKGVATNNTVRAIARLIERKSNRV